MQGVGAGQPCQYPREKVENGYRFEVEDEGIGIPVEEQHKITKAFYMVDKSRAPGVRTALDWDLRSARKSLKIHHSELTIQSEQGKVSCIGFVLGDSL